MGPKEHIKSYLQILEEDIGLFMLNVVHFLS